MVDRARVSLSADTPTFLGGRAWRYELFPLTSSELPGLELLRALNQGLIPAHYLQDDASKSLKAYVQDYLKRGGFQRRIDA